MVFKPTPLELTEFVNEFLRCGGDEGERTPFVFISPLILCEVLKSEGINLSQGVCEFSKRHLNRHLD